MRIGNKRSTCGTCNRFTASVSRLTGKRLKAEHPDEYETLRVKVEMDLYAQVIEQDAAAHPALPEEIQFDSEGKVIL